MHKRKYMHTLCRATCHTGAHVGRHARLAVTFWGESVLGDRGRLHLVRCQKLTLLQNLQHQLFMSGGCTGSVSDEAQARACHSPEAAQLSRAAPARPSPFAPPSHRHSHRRPARAHVTDASAGQADWWCVAPLTGFVGSCEYGHCARRQACASGHSARQHRGSVDNGGAHTVPQVHAPATVRARPAAQSRGGDLH